MSSSIRSCCLEICSISLSSAFSSISSLIFMSAPFGNGCVGASILPREAAGTFSLALNKNLIKEA